MNREDHRIWSNADLDLEDWRDELQEEAEQLAEQAYYNGEINWKESDMEITQIYSSRKIERGDAR